MIQPSKPKPAKPDFVVTDIENWPDGKILSINTCWRHAETRAFEHYHCASWFEWWGWLIERAETDQRFRTIYAHNGGGWDWLSLIDYLLTDGHGEFRSISINAAGSKVVTAKVKVNDRISIALCDSLQLMRSSLEKLAPKFTGKNKVDLCGKLPHEIYLENPDLFARYERADVELLIEIMENALKIVREHIAEIDTFGYTIGSTALKVFRTVGLNETISIPVDEKLKGFLREGYTGGRVECFAPGIYESVKVYDINSLYPYAMLMSPVPTSDRGFWTGENYEVKPGDVGAFRIAFKQTRRDLPPVLTQNGVGIYEGEGVYYAPEIILLKEIDPDCPIKTIEGFCFLDSALLFGPFVNRLYTLRKTDRDGPLGELCKFLLNSLYGKFGQHSERETAIAINDANDYIDAIYDGAEIRPLNASAGLLLETFGQTRDEIGFENECPIFGITRETGCNFEHVGIAATITSAARCFLYRGILAAGHENVVYCDTDSVHTLGALPAHMVGGEIGQFKLETPEGKTAGAYAGKKLYALRYASGSEKVRAKGVSVGGRNGALLCYGDLCRICNGESYKVAFRQPTTLIELFSGKPSCVFQNRSRTLRKTATDRNGKS